MAGSDAIGTRVHDMAGVLRVWAVMTLMVHVGSSSTVTAKELPFYGEQAGEFHGSHRWKV